METLLVIISIVWSILGIILFFKIWGMTNNVKEIHDLFIEDRLKKLTTRDENTSEVTPHSGKQCEEVSEEVIPSHPFIRDLKKGDKVTIAKFGTCSFEGIWEGKYAFYPEKKSDLPTSPYLVNDVEPYLLIPKNKLTSVIF